MLLKSSAFSSTFIISDHSFATSHNQTLNRVDGEDLTQESLIKAWEKDKSPSVEKKILAKEEVKSFRDKCRWLNPESFCSCEAYLESYEDICDMQKRLKPSPEYFALSDNVPSSFDEESNKRIIEMFRTMPGFYTAKAWFERMIGLLNKHVGK